MSVRSAEWITALQHAAPEGVYQKQFVRLLAEPIPASATGRLRTRLVKLQALAHRLPVKEAANLRHRLKAHDDQLGLLYRLELATEVRLQLLSTINAAAKTEERGTAAQDKGLAPTVSEAVAGTDGVMRTDGADTLTDEPAKGLPPTQGEVLDDEKQEGKPQFDPLDWIGRFRKQPNTGKDVRRLVPKKNGQRFDLFAAMHDAINIASVGLVGVAGATGLSELQRRVPEYVAEEALQVAFNHLVRGLKEGSRRSAIVGRAGELAALHLAEWDYGNRFGAVTDLNDLRANFPVVDLLYQDHPVSVKTNFSISEKHAKPGRGASAQEHVAWERRMGHRYRNDFFHIIGSHPKAIKKQTLAARLILENLHELRQQGVIRGALDANSTLSDALQFIRRRTLISIPSDHVPIARNFIGQRLLSEYRKGKLGVLGFAPDLSDSDLYAAINGVIGRIKPNAVSSIDLRAIFGVLERHPDLQGYFGKELRHWPSEWGDLPFVK